ncbi:hypothetical protein BC831DRAFT_504386 [Entophlyctis helioformis]|nr:hypothetical protein BC831DRAFT_504386 [Entophlyctis helioformis]
MGRMVLFNRRLQVSSDDLYLTVLYMVLVRCVWTPIIIYTYVLVAAACDWSWIVRWYLFVYMILGSAALLVEAAICFLSTRGTMVDKRPRRFVGPLCHLDILLVGLDFVAQIFGIYATFGYPMSEGAIAAACTTLPPNYSVVLIHMVIIWALLTSFGFFLVVGTAFFGSRRKKRVFNMNKYLKVWQRRIEWLCSGPHSRKREGQEVILSISRELADYFHGVDWAVTDIAVGLILLKREQKMAREASEVRAAVPSQFTNSIQPESTPGMMTPKFGPSAGPHVPGFREVGLDRLAHKASVVTLALDAPLLALSEPSRGTLGRDGAPAPHMDLRVARASVLDPFEPLQVAIPQLASKLDGEVAEMTRSIVHRNSVLVDPKAVSSALTAAKPDSDQPTTKDSEADAYQMQYLSRKASSTSVLAALPEHTTLAMDNADTSTVIGMDAETSQSQSQSQSRPHSQEVLKRSSISTFSYGIDSSGASHKSQASLDTFTSHASDVSSIHPLISEQHHHQQHQQQHNIGDRGRGMMGQWASPHRRNQSVSGVAMFRDPSNPSSHPHALHALHAPLQSPAGASPAAASPAAASPAAAKRMSEPFKLWGRGGETVAYDHLPVVSPGPAGSPSGHLSAATPGAPHINIAASNRLSVASEASGRRKSFSTDFRTPAYFAAHIASNPEERGRNFITREDILDVFHFAHYAEMAYIDYDPDNLKMTDLFIHASSKNDLFVSPYLISFDHDWRSIVISVRGTYSAADVLVDLSIDLDVLDPFDSTTRGQVMFVHKGMLRTAKHIIDEIMADQHLVKHLLDPLSPYADYGIVVCGHSLGAGSLLLSPTTSVAPGFLLLLSIEAVPVFEEFVISIATGDSIVPRLSRNSMDVLKADVGRIIGSCELPKYKKTKIMVKRLRRRAGLDVQDDPPLREQLKRIRKQTRSLPNSWRQDGNASPTATRPSMGLGGTRVGTGGRRKRGNVSLNTIRNTITAKVKTVVKERQKDYKYVYVPRWARHDEFQHIIVSRSMMSDHFPFGILREFEDSPAGVPLQTTS